MHLFGYLGQAIQFRCVVNDTSKFTRIRHELFNGTSQILLSNDVVNTQEASSDHIHVEKFNHIYVIKLNPIKHESAGVYICEDDISNKRGYVANVTLYVIDYHSKPSLPQMRFIFPFWYPEEFSNETQSTVAHIK
jgi:hypothetical protein